ncbi:MetQ/NlpA family ABC transporter substrate-binding protein [Leifsonia sp. NPDC058292]|uniref:MetQ/NlpA family ABC transporter substrate-binding protein n=1 Tax=Leifsonia sp. NPDC058292 TaxID=3346428 RepID=UPI0036D7FDAE
MSEATPTPPSLPEKPKSRTGWIVGIAIAVIAVIVAVVLIIVNVTAPASSDSSKRVTVKIGTTEEAAPYWGVLKKAAAAENIDIQVVGFSDYTQANPALKSKQIDLNLFQHLLFLANYNVSDNADLVPIASTVVVPLPLYSDKYKSVDDIPQGAKIAIPNDATNQARALLVLQEAGLVKLKNGGTVLSTPADVEAGSKVTVLPVDAAQTAPALNSADGAIVNNNFALTAGIDPKSAIFQDDPKKSAAEPYINAFVARSADKNNKTFQKIAELYHTKPVQDAVLAESKNTAVIVQRPQSELTSILSSLEKTVRAAK